MKRFAAAAAAFTLAGLTSAIPSDLNAQDPMVGSWNGTLSAVGQTIEFVMHFSQNDAGELVGTADMQGQTGIPLSAVTHDHPSIVFSIEGPPGDPTFSGTHSGDTVEGTFSQGPASGTFTMSRVLDEGH